MLEKLIVGIKDFFFGDADDNASYGGYSSNSLFHGESSDNLNYNFSNNGRNSLSPAPLITDNTYNQPEIVQQQVQDNSPPVSPKPTFTSRIASSSNYDRQKITRFKVYSSENGNKPETIDIEGKIARGILKNEELELNDTRNLKSRFDIERLRNGFRLPDGSVVNTIQIEKGELIVDDGDEGKKGKVHIAALWF